MTKNLMNETVPTFYKNHQKAEAASLMSHDV